MFALRFGAYQMLLSNDINSESRILFLRNIRERVQKLAPFLAFDRDPYLVVADGRLFWMYDAYTTSARYPYSTPSGPEGSTTSATPSRSSSTRTTARRRSTWRTRPIRSPPTYARIFPGDVRAARRDAGVASGARALSGGHLRHPGLGVRHVPHDAAGGLLQPRGSVGGAGHRRHRRRRADAAVLHDHAAAR